jgi:hypothetical protein
MSGFHGSEAGRRDVDDDGQFVIQIVSGCCGNGTGAVGVRKSFHTWMVAGGRRAAGAGGFEASFKSTKNKKMSV